MTYQTLVVVTKACEKLVICIKQSLTDKLKPLTPWPTPVQS